MRNRFFKSGRLAASLLCASLVLNSVAGSFMAYAQTEENTSVLIEGATSYKEAITEGTSTEEISTESMEESSRESVTESNATDVTVESLDETTKTETSVEESTAESTQEETLPEKTPPEELLPEGTFPAESTQEETLPEGTLPEENTQEEPILEETKAAEIIEESKLSNEILLEDRVGTGPYDVSGTAYDTLAKAVEAVSSNGTITLQSDAQEEGKVEINKPLTIELNGFKLKGVDGTDAAGKKVTSQFYISSNVKFVGTNGANEGIEGTINGVTGSSLELTDCKVTGKILAKDNTLKLTNCTVDSYVNADCDKVDITDSVFISSVKSYYGVLDLKATDSINISGGSTSYNYSGTRGGSGALRITKATNVNITNHVISSTYNASALYFYNNVGTVTVDGCTIDGIEVNSIKNGNSITVINSNVGAKSDISVETTYKNESGAQINLGAGNTFEGRLKITANTNESYKYSVNITDGTFNYAGQDDIFYNANTTGGVAELKNRLNLTGGSFKKDVNEYVASGYEAVEDSVGYYNIIQSTGSGPIYILDSTGKTYYADLASAIAESNGRTVYIGEAVTLGSEDLSGVTLKSSSNGILNVSGSLDELLATGVKLDGVKVSLSGTELGGLVSENGKLTAGSGFESNYQDYTALLAQGYIFDADSFTVKNESEFQAKIGYLGYYYLNKAISVSEKNDSAAKVNDEIVLLRNISGATTRIDEANACLTIDLNGFEINNTSEGLCITKTATGSDITIKNGAVAGKNAILAEPGNIKLNISNCRITGKDFGVVTNGSQINVDLTMDNVNITAVNHGMYLAANGTSNITAGMIAAATGIEIRAGQVNITGTVIVGDGAFSEAPNGSGTTTSGVGVAVAQHVTKHPINVRLLDCSISGTENAIRQKDIQQNGTDNVMLTVNGGTYIANTAVYSENCTKFIQAGAFSTNPESAYIIDGHEATEQSGMFVVHEIVSSGATSDGNAIPEINESVIPEVPVVPELPQDKAEALKQSHEEAKNSITAMSSNTAIVGNAEAVDNLANAAAANNMVNKDLKTQVSLTQELTEAEFETIINKDANGVVTEVKVLPKKLVFEVTAHSLLLDENDNIVPNSEAELDMSKNKIINQRMFRFRLPVPATVTAKYANVEHTGDPLRQYRIEGEGNSKYITVTTWHLSPFILTFTNEVLSSGSSSSGGSHSSRLFVQNKPNGIWKLDEIGWWFLKTDGTYPKDQWYECSWNGAKNWYHFNAKGYLDSGWFTDKDRNIYYLHDLHDNNFGYMYTGWNWIGNKCYYFAPVAMVNYGPEGSLVKSAVTPDGYTVNEHGEWTVDGKIQVK